MLQRDRTWRVAEQTEPPKPHHGSKKKKKHKVTCLCKRAHGTTGSSLAVEQGCVTSPPASFTGVISQDTELHVKLHKELSAGVCSSPNVKGISAINSLLGVVEGS